MSAGFMDSGILELYRIVQKLFTRRPLESYTLTPSHDPQSQDISRWKRPLLTQIR